jgi:hypothetical protein
LTSYELGERLPAPGTVEACDQHLGTGTLLSELFQDVLTEQAANAVGRSRTSSGEDARDVKDGTRAEVQRREQLGLLGGAKLLAPVAERLEELRRGTDTILDASSRDRDVDEWERVAWDHSCAVGTVPSPGLIPDLAADFAEVEHRAAATAGPLRTRLLAVMGQLAALMAIALIGVGDHRTARRWWRTAARAADQVGNPDLAAIVRGRQSVLALYDTRPIPSVISLAEEGIAVGHGAPRAGVMSSHATIAQAWADLGQHDRARDALRDLEDLFERLPDAVTRERDSQWGWTEMRLRHVQSYVHTRRGDLPRAHAAQDHALALYPEYSYQGRAQVEMHRAATVIIGGDPGGGIGYAVRVLQQLPTDRRGDALVAHAARDTLSLVPQAMLRSPAVREAQDLLGITGAGG